MSERDKRRDVVEGWKSLVKRRVGAREVEKWSDRLHTKVKATVHL